VLVLAALGGVLNNAGILFTRPFTGYAAQDFELLSRTTLQGGIFVTQLALSEC